MNKIRVAYLDIDKTLVGSGSSSISGLTRTALLTIPFRGVNTMRNIEGAKQPFREGDLNLPFITLNGAQVWNLAGDLIYSLAIDQETIEKLTDCLEIAPEHLREVKAYPSDEKVVVIFAKTKEGGEKIIAEYPDSMPKKLITKVEELVAFLRRRRFSYLGICFDDTYDKFRLPDLSNTNVRFSENNTKLSVYPRDASKTTTLHWVCETILKINPAEVLTAGDDLEIDGKIFGSTMGISVGEIQHPHAKYHSSINELPKLLIGLFSERDEKILRQIQ